MKYMPHHELWNLKELLDEYNEYAPKLSEPEKFLIQKALTYQKEADVKNILCIGCGAGREVLQIHQQFPAATIYANDIATEMIENAKKNFEKWNISSYTETMVGSVGDLSFNQMKFQLITCFGNVSNFFFPKQNRIDTFKKLGSITSPNGILIGMVHQIFGTPQKTLYFLLKKLITPFRKDESGDRIAGRKNQKYKAHYYTRKELHQLLSMAGYQQVEIISLQQFYALNGRKYDRIKGFNNLLFIARKLA